MARTISLALALCLLALGAQAALLDHRNPEALVSAGRKLMQANRELLAKPSIINGLDAVQGRYPWFVSIRVLDGVELTADGFDYTPDDVEPPHDCGGMMLATNNTFYKYVLTAAHCFLDANGAKDNTTPMVIIGAYKNAWNDQNWAGVQVRTTYGTFCHNLYNQNTDENDICIIVLNTQVVPSPTGTCANCVKLWPNNTAPATGYPATAIGLGYIDNLETEPVNLKEVDLKVVSNADCNLAFANYGNSKKAKLYNKLKALFRVKVPAGITSTMICASNPGPTPLPDKTLPKKDACQGDSGGPLFYKGATAAADLVFGATSFGVECGQIPGVWANVPNYNTWIQTQINSLNSTINEYAVRITLNDTTTKKAAALTLNLDQQFRAAQFISYLLGKKSASGQPNFWNADFYYLRGNVMRIGYSSGSNFAAQIAKWDAQLGGPKSATPKGCDNVRTQTMNLLMYNMRLLDTTYVASIEITGGFGATKLSNLYNVAAPEC